MLIVSMRFLAVLVGLVVLALPGAALAQAPAAPHVAVGIGEQNPAFFDDSRFRATGIRHARLIVPFDLVRAGGDQLASADAWLAEARRREIEPLVTFAHSSRRRRQFKLPSVSAYIARVREFRRRYPWVRELSTWNEANLRTVQPTGNHPRRTAAFYRALRRECRLTGCNVVAVEVQLTGASRTWEWVRRFRRAAGRGPHVWGVHNYPDVTRLSRRNTGIFLRRVPRDKVWITETGGIVRFRKSWPFDERRAARAVRHSFHLAASSRRIERMYLYNWRADLVNRRWDSGILAADGSERRAYGELLDGLALPRFRPPPPPVVPMAEPDAEPPSGVDGDD